MELYAKQTRVASSRQNRGGRQSMQLPAKKTGAFALWDCVRTDVRTDVRIEVTS